MAAFRQIAVRPECKRVGDALRNKINQSHASQLNISDFYGYLVHTMAAAHGMGSGDGRDMQMLGNLVEGFKAGERVPNNLKEEAHVVNDELLAQSPKGGKTKYRNIGADVDAVLNWIWLDRKELATRLADLPNEYMGRDEKRAKMKAFATSKNGILRELVLRGIQWMLEHEDIEGGEREMLALACEKLTEEQTDFVVPRDIPTNERDLLAWHQARIGEAGK